MGAGERVILTCIQYHVQTDSYWETAEQHGELSSVLSIDDLEGGMWVGGREAQDGGHMYIYDRFSLYGRNQPQCCKAIILQFKTN